MRKVHIDLNKKASTSPLYAAILSHRLGMIRKTATILTKRHYVLIKGKPFYKKRLKKKGETKGVAKLIKDELTNHRTCGIIKVIYILKHKILLKA